MSCACTSTKKYQIELSKITEHNNETYSYDFTRPESMKWSEGDSSKLYLEIGSQIIGKKFSYATLSSELIIRFTTRVKSIMSDYKDYLSKLNIGDQIEISEPTGDFKLKRENRPVILLSNGVGIAASRSLIMAFRNNGSLIPELTQINVDSSGKIYFNEFERFSKEHSGFNSYYESHRVEYYNRLDHEIQSLLNHHQVDPFHYVVGSNEFVNDTITHLKSVGFTDEDIITDGHISTDGACGCSTTEGCGCGSNITTFDTENKYVLPVVSLAS